ncbi:hypothetical protein ACQQ2N_00605 [Dokdonella sp. MW10]|uniref:hypothetical protein n=1 Tax=Dokdonella sp. MW10 TaxID=2992926 RepID=UPI003F7D4364
MTPTTSRHSRALRVLILATGLALAPTVFAQKGSTLEERMSAAQFKAYGLDKLTAEELKGLNDWLQGRGGIDDAGSRVSEEPGSRDPKFGFRAQDSGREAVQAKIVGTFRGWSGKTIFKLDNGQEWQQAEAGSYSGQTYENPEVTIKPKLMGNWLLVVEPCQCRVSVTRIK